MSVDRRPSILDAWDELTRDVTPPARRYQSATFGVSAPVGAVVLAAVGITALALLSPRVADGPAANETASPVDTTPASPPAQLGFRSLPIDATLSPLSLSALSPKDEAALDQCVIPENRDQVAGAAWLPSAHDVGKYMATNGHEPDLQADRPVFLVQLQGRIITWPGTLTDPVCMVIPDFRPAPSLAPRLDRIFFAPYDDAGKQVPFPGMKMPTLSLPPLMP